jgi:predicted nucleic-acid-binding protein
LIGVDTNVIVRFLVQDDDKQSRVANRFFESTLSTQNRGFISTVVLAELCWVLHFSYRLKDTELFALIRDLLETPQLVLEKRDLVNQALRAAESVVGRKAGFVDFLTSKLAENEGCEYCVSFDVNAARAAGMKLLV